MGRRTVGGDVVGSRAEAASVGSAGGRRYEKGDESLEGVARPGGGGRLNDVLGQSCRKGREESLSRAAAAVAAAAPPLRPRPHPCPLYLQGCRHSTPLRSLPPNPPASK